MRRIAVPGVAVPGVAVPGVAAAVLALTLLAGCGSGTSSSSAAEGQGGPTTAAEASPTCTSSPPTVPPPSGATTDLTKKPDVVVPSGPPPCTLVVSDIVTGRGASAQDGKTLTVQYVGVTYSDGQEFDSSWGRSPFQFTLGQGRVIQGWDQGLQGMRVGGRRRLVIPADLAYGPSGQGPIGPGATLVFDVDLLAVS